MKTYCFANQKGGVGKSTFAVHKAIACSDAGDRVLFIDMDAQANSTGSLRNRAHIALDAIELFGKQDIPNIEAAPGITLIQASHVLDEVERMLDDVVELPKRHMARFRDRFDVCIIDTPPTLGLRLIAALTISDFVISPIELDDYSIQGIQRMIQTINGVRGKLNPKVRFLGMLPNRVNSRSKSHRTAIEELLKTFPDIIIKPPMVQRVAIQQALGDGKAVWEVKNGAARTAAKEMRAALKAIDTQAEKHGG